jgi:hypothetical protein
MPNKFSWIAPLAHGATQIRRTELRSKNDGRRRSVQIVRLGSAWGAAMPTCMTLAIIPSDVRCFELSVAGRDAGFCGARFAQHGCSAPQGMRGRTAGTNKGGATCGCTPGQHD